MNTGIDQQLFLVGGAGSGFGKAIALALAAEGATVIAVARSAEKLADLQKSRSGKIETMVLDLAEPASVEQIVQHIGQRKLHGVLVNAGGPPAKTALETTLEDWDQAYRQILRWKIALTQRLVPLMQANGYGRFLFIESSSVKQPLENLVLSNAMRLAVVGFVKTISQEIARSGITLNILAPGSHDTPAIERIYQKKAAQTGISVAQAREQGINAIPVGALGSADDFASLAVWLLSPAARYITGQTISVDGGMVKGAFG